MCTVRRVEIELAGTSDHSFAFPRGVVISRGGAPMQVHMRSNRRTNERRVGGGGGGGKGGGRTQARIISRPDPTRPGFNGVNSVSSANDAQSRAIGFSCEWDEILRAGESLNPGSKPYTPARTRAVGTLASRRVALAIKRRDFRGQ